MVEEDESSSEGDEGSSELAGKLGEQPPLYATFYLLFIEQNVEYHFGPYMFESDKINPKIMTIWPLNGINETTSALENKSHPNINLHNLKLKSKHAKLVRKTQNMIFKHKFIISLNCLNITSIQ